MTESTQKRFSITKFIQNHAIPKSKALLLAVAEIGIDLATIASVMPQEYPALIRGGPELVRYLRNRREDKRLLQSAYALQRRRCLHAKKMGVRLVMSLTEKGVAEVVRIMCCDAGRCADGSSILVTFDIPEKQQYARVAFRTFLRSCGFEMHQKSVWITDRDIMGALQAFIQRTGIEEWVSVFRVYPTAHHA